VSFEISASWMAEVSSRGREILPSNQMRCETAKKILRIRANGIGHVSAHHCS
jgi:hypothetical protein